MEERASPNLWQSLHNSARVKKFPLRVMFELTYKCNFHCPHCYVPFDYRKKKELKTEEVFLILDQLRDIGCFYLGFTGGEPLVRKDIFEIFRYAKRSGFEIIIYTNGSLIDKNTADFIADIRPNKVDITIPAMTQEAFERITGLAGSRNRVFRAIERLKRRKVNLGFKSCVLKENQHEIKEIQEFCASLNSRHRLDTRLTARLDGSKEPFRYRGRLGGFSPQRSLKKRLGCATGLSQAAITPQGELKACVLINNPQFNILDTSLEDCWERLKQCGPEIFSSLCPVC